MKHLIVLSTLFFSPVAWGSNPSFCTVSNPTENGLGQQCGTAIKNALEGTRESLQACVSAATENVFQSSIYSAQTTGSYDTSNLKSKESAQQNLLSAQNSSQNFQACSTHAKVSLDYLADNIQQVNQGCHNETDKELVRNLGKELRALMGECSKYKIASDSFAQSVQTAIAHLDGVSGEGYGEELPANSSPTAGQGAADGKGKSLLSKLKGPLIGAGLGALAAMMLNKNKDKDKDKDKKKSNSKKDSGSEVHVPEPVAEEPADQMRSEPETQMAAIREGSEAADATEEVSSVAEVSKDDDYHTENGKDQGLMSSNRDRTESQDIALGTCGKDESDEQCRDRLLCREGESTEECLERSTQEMS